jgi:ABC-2 type transport system permease protein
VTSAAATARHEASRGRHEAPRGRHEASRGRHEAPRVQRAATGFAATARHELRSAHRERMPQALLIVLLGMVAASSLIGWLTHRTVTAVWEQTRADGLTQAANPFGDVPALYYAANVVIYVVLIGALLAIALGATSALRGRASGTLDLVLSRPVDTRAYLAGKLAGTGGWLGLVLLVAAVVNWVSISVIVGGLLGVEDTLRLVAFYGLAWLFLLVFLLLGLLSGIHSRRETTALLVPIATWSVLAFVLPQLGTAARPVSLLNPVPSAPTEGGAFDVIHSIFGPLSLTEQFKTASGSLLGNERVQGSATAAVLSIVVALLLGGALLLSTPRGRLRRGLHE